jgi:hypothetical protein
MTLTTLLLIILVVMLVSGGAVNVNGQPYFGAGPYLGGGLLGTALIVVVILLVLGRI